MNKQTKEEFIKKGRKTLAIQKLTQTFTSFLNQMNEEELEELSGLVEEINDNETKKGLASQVEMAHEELSEMGVPKRSVSGRKLTLYGRCNYLKEKLRESQLRFTLKDIFQED
jgi:hypothetical protein